jgi:hypothetical protein
VFGETGEALAFERGAVGALVERVRRRGPGESVENEVHFDVGGKVLLVKVPQEHDLKKWAKKKNFEGGNKRKYFDCSRDKALSASN